MSVIKISELTEKTTLAGTEDLLINDSGTSKKMKTSLIKNIQTACETAQTAAETAETNAASSASAASSSASAASTSASNAASSASAASTSASSASSSASSASTSASAASSAQSAAESARDATLAAYDSFDDRYLGVKASAPSLDNDGNALVAGALYFDSTSEKMQLWTGSAWVDAYTTGSSFLAVASNLSDLNNAATARTNLGLGTAATTASTDYATAAQGTNADTAYGWGNHASAGYMTPTYTGNVDVTGTVTADDITISDSSPTLTIIDSDTNATHIIDGSSSAGSLFIRGNTTSYGSGGAISFFTKAGIQRLKIDNDTGDISFYEDTGTTPKFFWDASAESLGIGTSSPLNTLHINSSGFTGLKIQSARTTSTQNIGGVQFADSTGASKGAYLGLVDGSLALLADNSEAMRIDSSGRVGIGTSSPAYPLVVDNGTNSFVSIKGTSESGLLFSDSAGNAGSIQYEHGGNFMLFRTNDAEAMRIDSSGNLLVGTTSLTVGGGGSGVKGFRVDGANGIVQAAASSNTPAIFNRTTTDGTIIDLRKDGTTVGSIGNSGSNLTVASAGELRFFTSTSNEDMRLETDGDLHVDGNVIAYSTTISDERLKENIEVVTDATSKLKQIRGVTFTRKDSGEQSAGVIAQEIEKILPQAVKEKALPLHTGTEDFYKTVEYDALHAVLIEAVKELTARVEQLEKNNG